MDLDVLLEVIAAIVEYLWAKWTWISFTGLRIMYPCVALEVFRSSKFLAAAREEARLVRLFCVQDVLRKLRMSRFALDLSAVHAQFYFWFLVRIFFDQCLNTLECYRRLYWLAFWLSGGR